MRFLFCVFICLWAGISSAEMARVDPRDSVVRDGWGKLLVELQLSEVVPYRVFTLDAPRRLVLDFADLDWSDVDPDALLDADRASGVRVGPLRPGWSRMVVDLAEPLRVTEAGLKTGEGGARLLVVLEPVSEDAFAAAVGAPPAPGWDALGDVDPQNRIAPQDGGRLVVVIDPGHGGIDPGADRGGIKESALMLQLGREVAAALNSLEHVQAILTRETDVFVPLHQRLSKARAVGADLMISLHADALEEDQAQGASVYTLSPDGGDAATRLMVERHQRGDLLAGVDLRENTDGVASVLMDMARRNTGAEAGEFADTLVSRMEANGVRMNSRPRRAAQLVVLSAADFASVLVEAGFLSNDEDRATLLRTEGRLAFVKAIVEAVLIWGAVDG